KASSQDDNIKKSKWKLALEDAWGFFYPLLPYLLIGVFIGAFIYDFIPQEFIGKYAGGDKPWTIPIASLVGIPMYIRAEAILPIGDALVSKGMGIGSVIALLIGGAGASIPEVVLLSKFFKKKLVIIFVFSILLLAIGTELIFQFFFKRSGWVWRKKSKALKSYFPAPKRIVAALKLKKSNQLKTIRTVKNNRKKKINLITN